MYGYFKHRNCAFFEHGKKRLRAYRKVHRVRAKDKLWYSQFLANARINIKSNQKFQCGRYGLLEILLKCVHHTIPTNLADTISDIHTNT